MRFHLKNRKLTIELNLNHNDWWLYNEAGVAGKKDFGYGLWFLAGKIDRGYKGKDPDIAVPTLLIESEEMFKAIKRLGLDIVWDEKGAKNALDQIK